MTRTRPTGLFSHLALLALAGTQLACGADTPTQGYPASLAAARAGYDSPGTHRQYGTPFTLGEGKVRTYVVVDARDRNRPLEIGVAIDAATMEGALPGPMRMMIPLELPQLAPEPYEFVLFDWNPEGHIPPGVYDIPHFDFHFYFTPHSEVQAIDPSDPQFAAKANNLPAADFLPPGYIVPTPPGVEPAMVAAPGMGVHWEDMQAPQLQMLFGNPAGWAPFTKTFIYGSWNGEVTFIEPMITRDYLLRRVDETITLEQPARVPQPGWYPATYRMTYDAQAREYRVALNGLAWRD